MKWKPINFWNMRKLSLAVFLFGCADYGLPGAPYVYTPISTSMGDSIYVRWSSVEGADFYRLYADSILVYEGKETYAKLGYAKVLEVKAYGLRDETSSSYDLGIFVVTETLLVKPQTEAITFENGRFSIASILDTGKYSYFVLIFSESSSDFGKDSFVLDSLWIFSASKYYSGDITLHKLDTSSYKQVASIPAEDSVKFNLHRYYVLWYSPDTLGWDSLRDIFAFVLVDSLVEDSVNRRLRVILKFNTISGLRWFY